MYENQKWSKALFADIGCVRRIFVIIPVWPAKGKNTIYQLFKFKDLGKINVLIWSIFCDQIDKQTQKGV